MIENLSHYPSHDGSVLTATVEKYGELTEELAVVARDVLTRLLAEKGCEQIEFLGAIGALHFISAGGVPVKYLFKATGRVQEQPK
jgi:hypothetical protein